MLKATAHSFLRDIRDDFMKTYTPPPNPSKMPMADIGRALGQKWRSLSEAEKDVRIYPPRLLLFADNGVLCRSTVKLLGEKSQRLKPQLNDRETWSRYGQ